jgi:hypothetical protein
LASGITINFPWGSLLMGLLDGESGLLEGLRAIARPGASLKVTLNAGALAEAGHTLDSGGARVRRALRGEASTCTPRCASGRRSCGGVTRPGPNGWPTAATRVPCPWERCSAPGNPPRPRKIASSCEPRAEVRRHEDRVRPPRQGLVLPVRDHASPRRRAVREVVHAGDLDINPSGRWSPPSTPV